MSVCPSLCKIELGQHVLHLDPNSGSVRGWQALVDDLPQVVKTVVHGAWRACQASAAVANTMESQTHQLEEVLHVFVYMFKMRRANGQHPLRSATASVCLKIRDGLLDWVSHNMTKYVVQHYSRLHDLAKPAPALRRQSNGAARPYTRIDPEAIWQLFEQSRASSASLAQILIIRHKDRT